LKFQVIKRIWIWKEELTSMRLDSLMKWLGGNGL